METQTQEQILPADDLDIARYRDLSAQISNLCAEKDALKDRIKAGVQCGLRYEHNDFVCVPEVVVVTDFDWKTAVACGDISPDMFDRYVTRRVDVKYMFRKAKDKEVAALQAHLDRIATSYEEYKEERKS